VPSRDEWENSLPRFRGEEWEVPAEHFLDFHDYMHRLQVVHEDVQIRLFYFSLEGIARDWYRSLPSASVSSLAEFHAAFHVFCKGIFSVDFLYPECCHEFYLLNKDPNIHEDFATAEDTSHHDQEMGDLQDDNRSDAFDIVLNASIKDGCHEDQNFSSENFKGDEQIDKSTGESVGSTVDDEGNSQFSGLQTKKDYSIYEEEQKSSDQQSIFNIEGVQHHFHFDPISKLNQFWSDENWLCHQLKLLFYWLCIPSFFGSRSRMLAVNQFLIWLHWKFDFT
jgi:hypothetical protein